MSVEKLEEVSFTSTLGLLFPKGPFVFSTRKIKTSTRSGWERGAEGWDGTIPKDLGNVDRSPVKKPVDLVR